nr:SDR family oxidoreductase [Kribbella italica]
MSTRAGIDGDADELLALGDLGGLVSNAGGWLPGEQYPESVPDVWLSALTLNLIAPMLLTQRLWPELAENRGAVVGIGSSGGLGDMSYGSPEYGAAKAGVRRFTASLGDRTDVRVMAVVPGWIGLDRALVEWAELTPEQQRQTDPPIPPEDVARVVADLLESGQAGEVVRILKPQEYHSTRAVQRSGEDR